MRVVKAVLLLSVLAVVLTEDQINDSKKWVEWIKAHDIETPNLGSRMGEETESSKTAAPDLMYHLITKEVLKILSSRTDQNIPSADDEEFARRLLMLTSAEEPPEITNSISPATGELSDEYLASFLLTASPDEVPIDTKTKKGSETTSRSKITKRDI